MALRIIQPTPWRARTASVSSERVLFCVAEEEGLVGCLDTPGVGGMGEDGLEAYHDPFAGDVFHGDFGRGGHCEDRVMFGAVLRLGAFKLLSVVDGGVRLAAWMMNTTTTTMRDEDEDTTQVGERNGGRYIHVSTGRKQRVRIGGVAEARVNTSSWQPIHAILRRTFQLQTAGLSLT
jgi:hypothetical protein